MTAGTKQSEKDYLTRSGSLTWERAKPFSPAGSETLDDSAQMLHDFAVAMLALRPSPSDLILDLGAGACWCSDLLGRLNRAVIAVDISLDMLRAGRSRPGAGIRAVAGDMESLPFRSGTFQKAICLNAFHHVPDMAKALGEVSRVLAHDGVAVFSEPGQGHADAPVSETAVRNFGVLEQDVLIGPFVRQCRAAGFEHVTVKPLLQAVPGFDLTLEQWDSWSRLASSTRPRRALAKIALGVAEFFGLGKQGPLFEEAMAIHMVRTVRQVVEHHPVILAAKHQPAEQTNQQWRAAIDASEPVPREGAVELRVNATNLGWRTWRVRSASGIGQVSLGVQLLDADGRMLSLDHYRALLPHDVAQGRTVTIVFSCPLPGPGRYRLKLDLCSEGVTWFETAGSTPVSIPIVVT